ncbi:MAG TPA: hypothetical protein VMQ44_02775 [Candidatus Saccharimonadales bacterium]|nr:hypothetical protein [Candidatus Saccharimonadales bacterium]
MPVSTLPCRVIKDGKTVFSGKVVVADDIDGVELTHGTPISLERRGERTTIPPDWIMLIAKQSQGGAQSVVLRL